MNCFTLLCNSIRAVHYTFSEQNVHFSQNVVFRKIYEHFGWGTPSTSTVQTSRPLRKLHFAKISFHLYFLLLLRLQFEVLTFELLERGIHRVSVVASCLFGELSKSVCVRVCACVRKRWRETVRVYGCTNNDKMKKFVDSLIQYQGS